jgi:hypothetical protein
VLRLVVLRVCDLRAGICFICMHACCAIELYKRSNAMQHLFCLFCCVDWHSSSYKGNFDTDLRSLCFYAS